MRNPFRPRPSHTEPPILRHFVDVYWCDPAGTYLQGWVLLPDTPLPEVRVKSRSRSVLTERSPRDDLLRFFPGAVETHRAGFSAYLPGRPGDELVLVALLPNGKQIQTVVELPDHQLPVLPIDPPNARDDNAFPAAAPPGPILAVGVRSATADRLSQQTERLLGREVVGFDIHPGIGVDVVGDAHRLSDYFPRDHFAGILSASLIEHLAAPWLFAAECAKVLMPGGRMLHQAPWAWPTHAAPTDFWRFSVDALELLFGSELGLRTVEKGTIGSATILPTPETRTSLLLMPTTPSALTSWIEVEKIADSARDVSWPYDAESGARIATGYPVDGLSST